MPARSSSMKTARSGIGATFARSISLAMSSPNSMPLAAGSTSQSKRASRRARWDGAVIVDEHGAHAHRLAQRKLRARRTQLR